MKYRPYGQLRDFVESLGGEMRHERQGYSTGGAWVVELNGVRTVFRSNGAGFPELDRLYVPKVEQPTHYRDYSLDLIEGAQELWLSKISSESVAAPYAIGETVSEDVVAPITQQLPAIEYALPPIDSAPAYLERIEAGRNLPERNMEALVGELLVLLGHAATAVVFQVGRIDVLVRDNAGSPHMVVEVKTSLRSKPARDSALRQGFDYAAREGAPLVVITDADEYEVFNRHQGLDYEAMRVASFRMTQLLEADLASIDLLRPTDRA